MDWRYQGVVGVKTIASLEERCRLISTCFHGVVLIYNFEVKGKNFFSLGELCVEQ